MNFTVSIDDRLVAELRKVAEARGMSLDQRRTPADGLAFDRALFDFRLIVGHHHLRADKTDLHPGFPWETLIDEARLDAVGSS